MIRELAFPAADVAGLLAGNVYINVHTALNPAGEIRGQLTPGGANATGGDTFLVNDVGATALTWITLNLGADPVPDAVTVQGTANGDAVSIAAVGGGVEVSGLAYGVRLLNPGRPDALTLRGNGGNDAIRVDPAAAGLVSPTLDGGPGDDVLAGPGVLVGGPGSDTFDLSAAGAATVTMDTLAPQLVGGLGVVQFGDAIENLSGGGTHDTINARPLAVGRVLDGGGGLNLLNLDTLGLPGLLTPTSVEVAGGMAPVFIPNVAQLNLVNDSIVDVGLVVRRINQSRPRRVVGRGLIVRHFWLRNTHATLALRGPFRMALTGLPPGFRVVNAGGVLNVVPPRGTPVVIFNPPDNVLSPGEEIKVTVFYRPSRRAERLQHATDVFAGQGRG